MRLLEQLRMLIVPTEEESASAERRNRNPYRVDVRRLDRSAAAAEPEQRGEVFETDLAKTINAARLEHLEWMGLPVEGRTILDVGSGPGHLAQWFRRRGCRVTCMDARRQNIERMHELYPGGEGVVAGAEEPFPFAPLSFDIVFCYGLLYHVESPWPVIRNMERVGREMLLLETLVSDRTDLSVKAIPEPKSYNQAVAGVGCRPSPAWVTFALNRAGFDHVYAPAEAPGHPDFQFEWRDDGSDWRDGHPIRCIFVASRRRIESPKLVPLLAE